MKGLFDKPFGTLNHDDEKQLRFERQPRSYVPVFRQWKKARVRKRKTLFECFKIDGYIVALWVQTSGTDAYVSHLFLKIWVGKIKKCISTSIFQNKVEKNECHKVFCLGTIFKECIFSGLLTLLQQMQSVRWFVQCLQCFIRYFKYFIVVHKTISSLEELCTLLRKHL